MLTLRNPLSRVNPCQRTAFTSLVLGVFLNSPLVNPDLFRGITESAIYLKYGSKFQQALTRFGQLSSIQQISIIHKIQR